MTSFQFQYSVFSSKKEKCQWNKSGHKEQEIINHRIVHVHFSCYY